MKNAHELVEAAMHLAVRHHTGQFDRNNEPHIFHCFRVADAQPTPMLKIIALLHDVIEDAEDWAHARKKIEDEFGHFPEIVQAVEALTRGKTETWNDYYKRVRANKLACQVKLSDIEDNFAPRRCDLKIAAKYESYLTEYDAICKVLGISRSFEFIHPEAC